MPTEQWIAAPKMKSTPWKDAMITPDKPIQRQPDRQHRNNYTILQDIAVEDLSTNTTVQRILQGTRDAPTSASEYPSESDSDSEMSATKREQDTTYEDLMAQLELTNPGSTDKITTKLNLAHVVRFREALGTALGSIPSRRYDWGHSWLVDTQATYNETVSYTHLTLPTILLV